MSKIIDFYLEKIPQSSNFMLTDIWDFNDKELESVHTYIQWLFPIQEKSSRVQGSPVLSKEDIDAFNDDSEQGKLLRDKLHKSFKIMLAFYGLKLENNSSGIYIDMGEDFDSKKRNWLSPMNHNHLRLTRIMKSLMSLGLKTEAKSLHEILMKIYKLYPTKITETTINFWNKAINPEENREQEEQFYKYVSAIISKKKTTFHHH